jgi:hypothetical protein
MFLSSKNKIENFERMRPSYFKILDTKIKIRCTFYGTENTLNLLLFGYR